MRPLRDAKRPRRPAAPRPLRRRGCWRRPETRAARSPRRRVRPGPSRRRVKTPTPNLLRPEFVTQNHEESSQGLKVGLNLRGILELSGVLDTLKTLIEINKGEPVESLNMIGGIDLNSSEYPLLDLRASLASHLTIIVGAVPIDEMRIWLSTGFSSEEDQALSDLQIEGNLAVGFTDPVSVTIKSSLLLGDFIWDLKAFLPENNFFLQNGLNDLVNLVTGSDVKFPLPSPIDLFSDF